MKSIDLKPTTYTLMTFSAGPIKQSNKYRRTGSKDDYPFFGNSFIHGLRRFCQNRSQNHDFLMPGQITHWLTPRESIEFHPNEVISDSDLNSYLAMRMLITNANSEKSRKSAIIFLPLLMLFLATISQSVLLAPPRRSSRCMWLA